METVKEAPGTKPGKPREVIPDGKVKMINSGITRIVPLGRVDEFKKKGYVPV